MIIIINFHRTRCGQNSINKRIMNTVNEIKMGVDLFYISENNYILKMTDLNYCVI